MDGIAVHARDAVPDPVDPRAPVILLPDQYDPIDTGDVLPAGRDTVVMREHIRHRPDGTVEIPAPAQGSHARQIGEDFCAGELLLLAHHRLRPMDAALTASAGHIRLVVHTRPVVAIIPTGDEIRPIGTGLGRGEVLDTNSLLLGAVLREAGCDVRPLPIQPDQPQRIATAAHDTADAADLVLIIAGSSAGRDDHTADVLRTLGEVVVHGVAVKPGHPVVLGIHHGDRAVPIIGVSGYPVSAALTIDLFALPLLSRKADHRLSDQPSTPAWPSTSPRPTSTGTSPSRCENPTGPTEPHPPPSHPTEEPERSAHSHAPTACSTSPQANNTTSAIPSRSNCYAAGTFRLAYGEITRSDGCSKSHKGPRRRDPRQAWCGWDPDGSAVVIVLVMVPSRSILAPSVMLRITSISRWASGWIGRTPLAAH